MNCVDRKILFTSYIYIFEKKDRLSSCYSYWIMKDYKQHLMVSFIIKLGKNDELLLIIIIVIFLIEYVFWIEQHKGQSRESVKIKKAVELGANFYVQEVAILSIIPLPENINSQYICIRYCLYLWYIFYITTLAIHKTLNLKDSLWITGKSLKESRSC